LLPKQEQEFDQWFALQNFSNVLNISEYADWDSVGCQQRLWDKYIKGSAPWDLIMYCNNTQVVELGALCQKIDAMLPELSNTGQIYLALNKWCVRVEHPDSALADLDFDAALPIYVQPRLKNFIIHQYCYTENDYGGIGTWIHGNNRFWLHKK